MSPQATRTAFSDRLVYPQERHCQNCVSHEQCWNMPNSGNGYHITLPANWNIRASWRLEQLAPHFKGVWAQICQNFRLLDREVRGLRKQESEWEE